MVDVLEYRNPVPDMQRRPFALGGNLLYLFGMQNDDLLRTLRLALQDPPRSVCSIEGFQRAAVLVPIIHSAGSHELLLTRRTHDVETHKGQISFPGGVVDRGDRDSVHTALRETREELGIDEEMVTTVGLLDDLATPTGFIITPVVGFFSSMPPLRRNPREVAEVFFVPLSFFEDSAHVRHEQREFLGRMHDVWYYDTEKHIVWGATAAIIRSLLKRMQRIS
jgi:8-oxo-dGTP pyrophosphatase MutT (NUDIX family)